MKFKKLTIVMLITCMALGFTGCTEELTADNKKDTYTLGEAAEEALNEALSDLFTAWIKSLLNGIVDRGHATENEGTDKEMTTNANDSETNIGLEEDTSLKP